MGARCTSQAPLSDGKMTLHALTPTSKQRQLRIPFADQDVAACKLIGRGNHGMLPILAAQIVPMPAMIG
jgi:hypothetical protein